jgi:polyhydroxyalkanoate synthesis regulator phasin
MTDTKLDYLILPITQKMTDSEAKKYMDDMLNLTPKERQQVINKIHSQTANTEIEIEINKKTDIKK